ncbi:MAG: hypothetical protein ACREJN_04675 [Nitrospiraceae bacterium]
MCKSILSMGEHRGQFTTAVIMSRGLELGCIPAACQLDLEGIVAKPRASLYQTDHRSPWIKIKNPGYSKKAGRQELFERRKRTGS